MSGDSVNRPSAVVTGSRSPAGRACIDTCRAGAACRTVFAVGRRTRGGIEIRFLESRASVRPGGPVH